MHPWFRWLNYIDPVAYAFESLMINEFDGRDFPCSDFVPTGPAYADVAPGQRVCVIVGGTPESSVVSGGDYLSLTYNYSRSHLWRNLGILIAMTLLFCGIYLTAAEYISARRSKGEVLVFRRGLVPDENSKEDEEGVPLDRPNTKDLVPQRTVSAGDVPPSIQKQTAIFHWEAVNYDIKIKSETRRLLDDVDGWVKPGTLTAVSYSTLWSY